MRKLLLLFLLTISGCIAQTELLFEPGNGNCAGGPAEFTAQRTGDQISFSGAINTPNPCYSLNANHSISEETIQVDISAASMEGMCIMCTGQVPFNGSITGLEEKEYLFVLSERGNVLFEKIV